jgi:hypothetical protein
VFDGIVNLSLATTPLLGATDAGHVRLDTLAVQAEEEAHAPQEKRRNLASKQG